MTTSFCKYCHLAVTYLVLGKLTPAKHLLALMKREKTFKFKITFYKIVSVVKWSEF